MPTIVVRPRERRSFLTRVAAGAAAFGGTLFGGQLTHAQSEARSATAGAWKPARHTQDDWLDEMKGVHRLIIDTTSPQGLGSALTYGNNFFLANQDGYGLGNSEVALVIVVRHHSTPFAYSDAIWEKYGTPIGDAGDFDDPKTKSRPAINVYNSSAHLGLLPNSVTLDALTQRGVHFAVCQMATRRIARAIAASRGLNADAVYNELASNVIRNSHMVPAGIVTVNRAQERGYSFANVA
jgi:intracellular sulfur oxidation DsrE/DsrF family protein